VKTMATLPAQRGVTLVIGLIMLVVITLIITTAFTLSHTNFKSVSNMQRRDEAIAAVNQAIERKIEATPFTSAPSGGTMTVDINNDGNDDYIVTFDTPTCVRAYQAITTSLSSVTLGSSMSSSSKWDTIWEINASVTESRSGIAITGSGVSARVREGIRVLLTEAQKTAVCP
jgi:Tfp pilus assembly protein PilX